MIRINLLPRKPKPLITLWKNIAVFAGSILILVIGLFILSSTMEKSINELNKKIEETTKEIENSRIDLAKIEKLKTEKAFLEHRINLIDSLREKQNWPIHILDDLSNAIPDSIWLDSLDNVNDVLLLEGMTPSYNAVSEFMKKLPLSKYFKDVELINLQQSPKGDKIFHRFRITCHILFIPNKTGQKEEKPKEVNTL